MKRLSSKLKLYSSSFLMLGVLASCGTMQTTTNNDGIYDDEVVPKQRVVTTNQKNYNEYNENYFSNELKRLDNLNGTDIICLLYTSDAADD